MNSKDFQEILELQLERTRVIMGVKAREYAHDEDRLSNFKKAAHLTGTSVPEAVAGMMVKHTVSIYDMIEGGREYSIDTWEEKLTDHINYLILLKAAILENNHPPTLSYIKPLDHVTTGEN